MPCYHARTHHGEAVAGEVGRHGAQQLVGQRVAQLPDDACIIYLQYK
jgi:hypothetical protein